MDSRDRVILAGTEGTYGVDPTLDGSNAIKTRDLEIQPLQGNTVEDECDRPSFGNNHQFHVGQHVVVSFKVALVGSGTLGTAPAFGILLLACKMLETIVAVISVRYTWDSNGTDSVALYFYLDGNFHLVLGAKGTFSIEMGSQNIPYLNFTFTGLYADPTAAVAPSPTGWTNFQVPQALSNANTPTVSFLGFAATLKNLVINAGNEVVHFDDPGEESVQITDRKAGGNISVLSPLVSAKNYFADANANTLGQMQIVHGTTDNTRVIVDAPSNTVQLLQPRYGDDRGRATLEGNLSFVPTAALDDEFELRFAAA